MGRDSLIASGTLDGGGAAYKSRAREKRAEGIDKRVGGRAKTPVHGKEERRSKVWMGNREAEGTTVRERQGL